jgi:methionyl-tRNA synthetase
MSKRYLITSALPYANGALHLGHLAGAYLPADIYVRYLRLMGKDVVWVCGSDEHGAAITLRAKKEGISPQAIIDKYHFLNKDTFERLGISFDYYHRTSAQLHHETAQDFFLKLDEKGDQFDVKTTEQYYDEEFNQFLADRYIIGTCPKCGHEEAYGDQCENCGSDLSPTELINPRSTLSGKTPVLKHTKHWYFKLEQHEAWLREWIENGKVDGKTHHDPKAWKNHVIGQCLSWLDGGLNARAITRDLDWGIPVPVEGGEGKVLYVWFDAPIGYISSTKQWAKDNNKDWEAYWKDEDTQLIHFIGKDNIVFHCIIFPALLKAYGDYVLPVNVPANQFLNFEGQKFSKSRGWGIEQHQYLEEFKDFPNKEDALRYALIRNMPESKDADFKWDEFVDFHDKELADNLGNFVNRVIVLTNKYFEGVVPESTHSLTDSLAEAIAIAEKVGTEIEKFSFRRRYRL